MTRPAVIEPIARAAAEAIEPEPLQLELLAPSKFPTGSEQHERMTQEVQRQARGRPSGARNLVTAQTIDFVRRVFGDPLIESARWLLHSPQSLARELSCTAAEAFDRQEAIRRDLRRYCHPLMAPVDAQGRAVPPTLAVILGGAERLAPDGTVLPPWERSETEIKQIQGLSEPVPAQSHDEQSHEPGK